LASLITRRYRVSKNSLKVDNSMLVHKNLRDIDMQSRNSNEMKNEIARVICTLLVIDEQVNKRSNFSNTSVSIAKRTVETRNLSASEFPRVLNEPRAVLTLRKVRESNSGGLGF